MALEDYLPRPTVPQIRRDKTEVVHVRGNGLQQLASLDVDSEYLRITSQILPSSLFPSAKEVMSKRFDWNRNEVSRQFMKKFPLTKAFVGRSQDDIVSRIDNCRENELRDMFYNRLNDSSTSSPGMSFRPVITPNRSERVIFWDQLCAGALIYQKNTGEGMRVKVYDGSKSIDELGASAYVSFKDTDGTLRDGLTISHIPTTDEKAHILARAIYSDRQSNKTDFSVMQFNDVPQLDTKERKELDALVVAGWFGVCSKYASQGNTIAARTSVILYPSQELLECYTAIQNHTIIQVPQHQHDMGSNGSYTERRVNQAETSHILQQLIKSDPKKYLKPVFGALV